VEIVVGVGPLAREVLEGARGAGLPAAHLFHFADSAAAADAIGGIVEPGDAVLVKGSRGVRLETVVDALLVRFGERKG
jgi:UDP-N-acetylmuramoyl-tripeptide--D-alanyl-D-alanine ligase